MIWYINYFFYFDEKSFIIENNKRIIRKIKKLNVKILHIDNIKYNIPIFYKKIKKNIILSFVYIKKLKRYSIL